MWLNRKESSPTNDDRSGRTSSFRSKVCREEPTCGRSASGDSSVTAPHQNVLPTTEARWITARSSSSSWSRRAARSAWIVLGTATRDRSPVGAQFPLSRTSRPSSISFRSISSTNSGFPSAAVAMRSAASPLRPARPSRFAIKTSHSASLSGSRITWSDTEPQSGRRSRISGREVHSTNNGWSTLNPPRYCRRSRNVDSAQWMSSTTTTSGPSSVRTSRSRRTPQKVWRMSAPGPASSSPIAASISSAMRSPSSVDARIERTLARASSGDATSPMPATAYTSSYTGQNVMPAPYGRQRDHSARARFPVCATNSVTSRVLPSPASPITVATRHARCVAASSNARRRASNSSPRPTIGESRCRAKAGEPGVTPRSRNAGTASVLPFSASGSMGSTVTASRTRSRVTAPIRISPGSAACSRRAATLTVSPVTNDWPDEGSPAMTSPVLTPVRICSRAPQSRSSSVFSTSRRSRICEAARTARSASSSCTVGTPNTAMTASPMNFSTVPPWLSIAERISSKYRDMTPRRDSGSRRSPSAVDPVTSANRTVTVFRVSTRRSVRGARRAIARTGSIDSDPMEPRLPEQPGSPSLLRPRRVGEILGDAFRLYARHWQNLIVIVAVIVVPLSILQVLLSDLWIRAGFENEEIRGGIEVSTGTAIGGVFAALVFSAISVLMWTILTGAITRAAAGTFLGRDLELAESYRYGFARFWSIVLVGVLSALAIAGGFLLLIVPGFIVLTFLVCAIPALVIEDTRGRAALRRSWNLVRGYGWHVFGTIIVAALINAVFSGLLTAPFGDNYAARSIVAAIASVITMPFMALVGVFIYLDLRVRKERYAAPDLERDLASHPV